MFAKPTQDAGGLRAGGPAGTDINNGVANHQAGIRRDAHGGGRQEDRIRIGLGPRRAQGGDNHLEVGTQTGMIQEGQGGMLIPRADNSHWISMAKLFKQLHHPGYRGYRPEPPAGTAKQPADQADHLVVDGQPIGQLHHDIAW